MAQEQKTEVEKGLDEVRKEVIESRNLVIKTDNLLKNIHAEVKAVGQRQKEFERRQWISSYVAYTLFAVMASLAAWAASSFRVSGITQDRDRLEHSVKDLSAQLDTQKSETARNATAIRDANKVYAMMTELQGDARLKGIDEMARLDMNRLSTLEKQALSDRAELLRREVGQSLFERGRAAYNRNELTVAAEDLSRYLGMKPPDPHDVLEASFLLGSSYNMLKRHDKAVPLLDAFVRGNHSSKHRDYAMALLAQSYEATGQYDKAIEVARDGLGTYPNSQFASMLKARLSTSKHALSNQGGSAADAAPAAKSPTPGTPAAAPAPATGGPAAVAPAAPLAKPAR